MPPLLRITEIGEVTISADPEDIIISASKLANWVNEEINSSTQLMLKLFTDYDNLEEAEKAVQKDRYYVSIHRVLQRIFCVYSDAYNTLNKIEYAGHMVTVSDKEKVTTAQTQALDCFQNKGGIFKRPFEITYIKHRIVGPFSVAPG